MVSAVEGMTSACRSQGDERRRGRGHRRAGRVTLGVLVTSLVLVGCAPIGPPLARDQEVDQLISFVEVNRGHDFVTRPSVTFVSDAEFRQHVLAEIAAMKPELQVDEVAFKALGWMAPGDDLFELYRLTFGDAVVGFYNPATKVLEVRGQDLTPYRREVIVHELTHALDDQIFDLSENKGPGVLNEQQLAYLISVEGDAADIQHAYVASTSPLDQLSSLAEQLAFPISPEITRVPLALLSLSQAPYLQGPRFVAGLGGPSAVDSLFGNFPTTTEQAWDPAKYLAGEGAETVPVPPATGTVVASGTWGRFLTSLIITDGINLDGSVNPATDGWAGDSFVTWTSGNDSCIRIDTRQDDAGSAASLYGALDLWATRSAASVEMLDATTVRLTRCS